MKYRIGQKVRLLHDSGEGVITSLIDKYHVEVDLGDDFPIDVHVNEIVPVDSSEKAYIAPVSEEEPETLVMGPNLLDFSLTVNRKGDKEFEIHVINPERTDILFTCYTQDRRKFEGLAAGKLFSGEAELVLTCSEKALMAIKGFYIQIINYTEGKGHPHYPLTVELPWNRGKINKPSVFIRPLGKEGWILSLREDPLRKEIKKIDDSEFIRIVQQDQPKPRPTPEVDLHIEKLVKNPHEMKIADMLKTQTNLVEKTLSDALVENYASVVFIHGIGQGKLKKEVHSILRRTPSVKSFEQGDPKKYGNGATIVYFR